MNRFAAAGSTAVSGQEQQRCRWALDLAGRKGELDDTQTVPRRICRMLPDLTLLTITSISSPCRPSAGPLCGDVPPTESTPRAEALYL